MKPKGATFASERKLLGRAIAEADPPEESAAAARLRAAARLELARAIHHLRRTRGGRRVLELSTKSLTTKVKGTMHHTDTPSELVEMADGVSDDAASDSSLIGCGLPGISGGLGSLVVAGLPSYLFTRKSLSNPVIRRRAAAAIKAMTPKMRRRVMARLRAVTRISGAIRSITPSIAGYPSNVGWRGVPSISVGRCPYANVAGALTP